MVNHPFKIYILKALHLKESLNYDSIGCKVYSKNIGNPSKHHIYPYKPRYTYSPSSKYILGSYAPNPIVPIMF